MALAENEEYEAIFAKVAAEFNIDKHILAEHAWRESRWNPLAIGGANDMGIMQILPSTWLNWAPRVGVVDPFDPESNIRVGAAFFASIRSFLKTRLGFASEPWMLVSYNWGPYNVLEHLQAGKTWEEIPDLRRNYAESILLGAEVRALVEAEPVQ